MKKEYFYNNANAISADKQPLITLIAPVLNLQDYLKRCIDSVLNQTYKNFEFLIVDNGSNDNTINIIQQYSQQDSRIKLLQCNQKGVSKARNMGLQYAKGEYVFFVDGDDVIDKTYCQDLYDGLVKYNADMCIFKYKKQKKIKPIHCKKRYKVTKMDNLEAIKLTICDRGFNGAVYCKGFKASLLKNLMFDENIAIAEDLQFCVEYLYRCKSVVYIPKPVYHYYLRSNGAVLGRFNTKKLTVLNCLDNIINMSTDAQIIECAKAWKSIMCLMLINFYHRDKIKDENIKRQILNVFFDNKKYVKTCKYTSALYKSIIDIAGHIIKHW